ncbi:FUSC family membrane protein [Sphingobacterium griseoflavum]|uniref:FUSC family membrane protein n=1 Tax=Sphingobacterium griseoflavum TaxID=1474952 RepID=UPI00167A7CE9|nr:FUSC family membrane protein [Sphingobacterium griseoflavum]
MERNVYLRAKIEKVGKILKSLGAEYGTEALRTTLACMLPAVVISWIFELDYAIPFVIGTLNASMTDFPGHRQEKLQAALWSIVCAVLTSLLVGFSLGNSLILILLITTMAFVFTLFNALGSRIGMVGTTSLFLVAFVMGLKPAHVPQFAVCVGAGAAWFYLINILHTSIDPLWELRKAIANGYRTTALLLRVKATGYDMNVPLDRLYHRVAAISIKLADQQETVRHLLLRERRYLKREGTKAYSLWLRAYVLMDLYGMATAIDHDYEQIRERLEPIGALSQIHELVLLVADGMEMASQKRGAHLPEFQRLEEQIQLILAGLQEKQRKQQSEELAMLVGAVGNGRTFLSSMEQLRNRQGDRLMEEFYAHSFDLTGFLPPLSAGVKDLFAHVRSYSPLFMFAVRMLVLFLLGGLLGELLSDMKYTYWILITIIVVARPGYLLTQQRNSERLWGTLGGVFLGLLLIFTFPNTYVLLVLISVLLFAFLLFNKRYYMVSVFFITALVIVALHLHDDTWTDVMQNRVLFTLLGCGLAWLGWFLVPVRNKVNLMPLATQALKAQHTYFETVLAYVESGEKGERYEIRLERKRAFLDLTKFSDAVLQSQREPGKDRPFLRKGDNVYRDLYRLHAMISSLWIQHNQEVYKADPLMHLEVDRTQRIRVFFDSLGEQLR